MASGTRRHRLPFDEIEFDKDRSHINVSLDEILQFVDSLLKDNRVFELIYMPSRDHQFIGGGYVMRRDWDFMVCNLQAREPPSGYRIAVNRR